MMVNSQSGILSLSIVIPVYQNRQSLARLLEEIHSSIIDKYSKETEIIFVNDGSTDGSWEELLRLKDTYPNIVLLDFTRNFGQAAAVFAGFREARNEIICNMSADLQDPADVIHEMIERINTTDTSIVIAVRSERDESRYRKMTSALFYWLVRKLSFPEMPTGGFDMVVARRQAVLDAISNADTHPFYQGMFFWTGHDIETIYYVRRSRAYGNSQWTLGKKVKYLIDGAISYSYLPIRFASVSGLVISFVGLIYMVVEIVSYLFGSYPFKGWTPIVVLILFLSGANMAIIGIVGEYIWRIFENTKHRSMYIIKRRIR